MVARLLQAEEVSQSTILCRLVRVYGLNVFSWKEACVMQQI
jgi:hypothetical protein